MQSIREQIVREIVARVTSAVSPVRVLRQPLVAVTRDQSPAVIVSVESDTPVKRSNDRVERELVVRITALVRSTDDGYAIADDMLCRVHEDIFADVSLCNLAIGVTEMDTDYNAEDADADALAISVGYRVSYRTMMKDITSKG